MTSTWPPPPEPTSPAATSQEFAWPVQQFLAAQGIQWEAFQSWQRSVATFNKDLWEQWAVRYAGGLPIDG